MTLFAVNILNNVFVLMMFQDLSCQSFECAEWKVCFKNSTISIFGFYRPYSEKHQVTQSTSLLNLLSHYNKSTRKLNLLLFWAISLFILTVNQTVAPEKFWNVWKSLGMIQHVHTATHNSGHILDLIVTKKGDKLANVIIQWWTISYLTIVLSPASLNKINLHWWEKNGHLETGNQFRNNLCGQIWCTWIISRVNRPLLVS